MQVKAKTSFAHGVYSMHKGEVTEMPDGIAADLSKAGFVEEAKVKKEPEPENKKAPESTNKAKK